MVTLHGGTDDSNAGREHGSVCWLKPSRWRAGGWGDVENSITAGHQLFTHIHAPTCPLTHRLRGKTIPCLEMSYWRKIFFRGFKVFANLSLSLSLPLFQTRPGYYATPWANLEVGNFKWHYPSLLSGSDGGLNTKYLIIRCISLTDITVKTCLHFLPPSPIPNSLPSLSPSHCSWERIKSRNGGGHSTNIFNHARAGFENPPLSADCFGYFVPLKSYHCKRMMHVTYQVNKEEI